MRRLFFVLFALASPFLWNCSDNDKLAVADRSEPQVRIFYPYDSEPATFVVNDSIKIYFATHDLGQNDQPVEPTKVELWFSHPRAAAPVLIDTPAQLISIDQVPEEIRPFVQVPAGWSLYSRWWFTGPTPLPPDGGTPIDTGTDVQLFAVAYDAAGNVGRTPDVIRIHVTNFGDNIGPPSPDFTISPQAGTTATTFVFDPALTTDRIDSLDQISVRWDFDGNPANGWDIGWDMDARANQKQSWQYVTPRRYRVVLQAHNSYLRDSIGTASRYIIVTPIGGDPRPPEENNYCDIPAGIYVLGDSSYALDGQWYQTDAREQPIHAVQFTSDYRIERTEVTNQLYLDYLQKELNADSPSIEYRGGVIYSWDPAHPEAPQDVYFYPGLSEIFFNLDTRTFAIKPGFEEHPVTGATWFGASAYALAYGLRLPTEAEWEVAARGSNEAWSYPFVGGTELTRAEGPHRVNYAVSEPDSLAPPFKGATAPRGFYNGRVYQGFQTLDTPSVFGTYDMAGNVSEWVGDWLKPTPPFYPSELDTDPQGAAEGTSRVIRGGSYLSSRADVRCTARGGEPPDGGYASVGFRTAYIRPVPGR